MTKRKANKKAEPRGINVWIVREGEQVVVGHVIGDTFHKTIKGSIHLLQVPPCICSDVEALEQAQRYGAYRLQVVDVESGITYTTSMANFWAYGIEMDRGHNPQLGLLLGYWQQHPPGGVQMEMEL